jgi:hypothetical protein
MKKYLTCHIAKPLLKSNPGITFCYISAIGRVVYPGGFCTLKELAPAMILVGCQGYGKQIITPPDMVKLAK